MDFFQMKQELAGGKQIYDLPLRVTYYARVSTDKEEQAHSLQAQIQYYEEMIRGNSRWTFVSGYMDEGLSGTNVSKRDAFLKMIEDAKLGKFDFIITKEISRFSRSTLDSIRYTQELFRHGVGVYFQSDNINTLLPDSELRLTIMSSIAQDEVRKISERIKFGHKRSIEKGVVLGNSSIWGYQKADGRLVMDEREAKIVQEIFDLYANQGLGIRLVCEELTKQGYRNRKGNPFSFTTVRNIIANPKYKGYYCGGKSTKIDYRMNDRKLHDESEWVMYKDEENVPPIVSEELWDKANHILKSRSKKQSADDRTSYNNKYTYSGKIICMEHGEPYYRALYRYKSGNKEVWQCKRFTERGTAGCDSPTIYTAELDTISKQCYHAVFPDKAPIIQRLVKIYSSVVNGSQIKMDIAKIEAEISSMIAKKDKLLELAVDGRLSDEEFQQRNEGFNREMENLRARREEMWEVEKQNRGHSDRIESLRQRIANELDFEEGFNNQIVDVLLHKVEVHPTSQKNQIDLTIYGKVLPERERYRITRRRGEASVCSKQYI